jgi:hypothetical protein
MKRVIPFCLMLGFYLKGDEEMKKKMHVLVLSLFIVSVLFFSPVALTDVVTESRIDVNESLSVASDYVPREIRVAIYDEPNTTAPSYATNPGQIHNNATGLRDVLLGYGYDVTLLDVHDIYDYELTTTNYDVFCLVDNWPRENITNRVMDFWLGGGGLLVFDGSSGFLCSFGILPPEALGSSGIHTYWDYSAYNMTINERHPVAKSLSGSLFTGFGALCWDYPALQATSIAADLTMVATSEDNADWATILAFDPSDRGGKIVTIAQDFVYMTNQEVYPLYADAVDWLTPKPKARVLYDLTHQPWVSPDTWNWAGDANYLTSFRDGLVSRGYVVDKLYPSATGNLTSANLAPYDMLMTNQPLLTFASQEILDVELWVTAGGGLFVVGDNPGVPDNYHLDDLIAPYGIQFNDTVSPYAAVISIDAVHPTIEGCSALEYHGATNLILSGSAYPLWSYAPGEVAAGASEYGVGRVVVICDANSVADTWIIEQSNYQFAINVANWLTSSDAQVLLFHNTGIPGYNHYRSAVADALNELGINFMLTWEPLYFNLSLNSRDWDMVVYDANSLSAAVDGEFIQAHLENGGRLIMRDFAFRNDNYPLWHYIGFQGCGSNERIIDGAPSIYMWDEFHNVFNRPVDFAVDHFDSTANDYVTDWTNVTVLGNATAIAGITPTTEVNQSAILLGANGQALCNMFSISQYHDDFDDSTYPDNFELWLNEIAYMMRPTIDSPGNLNIELGGAVSEFTWTPHSYAPGDYQIKRNSAIIATHVWDGSPITVDISGLSIGLYEFQLMVRDHVGYRTDDIINVTIEDTLAPVWIVEPIDQTLDYGAALSQQLSASDPSGIGGWYVNDTTNFAINLAGLLTNNTFLETGEYGLTVSVEDTFGHIVHLTVTIAVSPDSPATTTEPTTPTDTSTSPTSSTEPPPGDGDITMILIIVGVGGFVMIVIIIIMKKK